MNWRIIAAVVVAFIVGAGAGVLAEHAHVQNDKTSGSASATTTTVPTADWFGTQKSSACPDLMKWYNVVAKAAYSAGRGPWPAARAALLQQASTVAAAFEALLPVADTAGKSEMEFLIVYQNRLTAALQSSTSAASYAASQRALASDRLSTDAATLVATARTCPKG